MADTQLSPDAAAGALAERVLARMQAAGGFPALESAIGQIVAAIEDGGDDSHKVANAVLSDVALTQKVLRLANSAMYAVFTRGVTTVTHAVMVLGSKAVGHLALGAKVIGSLSQEAAGADDAQQQLAQSLLAGAVAGAVAARLTVPNREEGVVCSLLNRLGKLLVAYYLPEEWRRIGKFVKAGRSEAEAVGSVLGVEFATLGVCVAEHWRLPATIVATLRPEPESGPDPSDWLGAVVHFANRAAAAIRAGNGEGPDGAATQRALAALAERYAPTVGLDADDLIASVRTAVEQTNAEPALASLLLETPTRQSKPPDSQKLLREGLADIAQMRNEGCTHAEVVEMVVELIYTALGLARIALFVRDPRQQAYRVRVSLAASEHDGLADVTLPEAFSQDVAHAALSNRVDIYIDNPRDHRIAGKLTPWIQAHEPHPFFLLPLVRGKTAFGLLFGQQGDDLVLDLDELLLIKALRDLLTPTD